MADATKQASEDAGKMLPVVSWMQEKIPQLVLGTAQMGLPGYGVANRVGRMEQEGVNAIIRAAWNAGVRFFDTAQAYGDSEERLGRAFLSLHIPPGEIRIITKLDPALDLYAAEALTLALESSRRRLGVECLWGVMLHRFDWLAHWNASLGNVLQDFHTAGGVKYFGVSVYEAAEALEAIEHPDMDIIQIPANAWDTRMIRANVFERARERGKLLFVRSVFLQGLLLLSPDEAEAKVAGAGLPSRIWRELCLAENVSPRQVALAWVASLGVPLVLGVEQSDEVEDAASILSHALPEVKEVGRTMEPLADMSVINPGQWKH